MASLEELGISNYISGNELQRGRIKVEPADFVVQEIYGNEICEERPKINVEAIVSAHKYLIGLSRDPNFEIGNGRILMEVRNEQDILGLYHTYAAEIASERSRDERELQRPDCSTRETVSTCRGTRVAQEFSIGCYTCDNKEERTVIHAILKDHLFVKTKTIDSKVHFLFSRINTYTFTVRKVDQDTASVASMLGKKLGPVLFAGNKDKRAVTYQRMSANTDFLGVYGCNVFDIRRGSAVKLGDLSGNRFTVRVRGCRFPCLRELKFLNYYGNQRFGKRLNNHQIGKLVLERREGDALEMIIRTYSDIFEGDLDIGDSNSATGCCSKVAAEVAPTATEKYTADASSAPGEARAEDFAGCRPSRVYELYLQQRYQDALCRIHPKFKTERHILICSIKGLDARTILKTMRRESLMLYLHSYQSYLFNLAVNKVLEESQEGCREGTSEVQRYLFDDGKLVPAKDCRIEDAWIELVSLNHPMCRGGYRKVVEEAKELKAEVEGNDTVLRFRLGPCVFATMAVRELIGNDILA